MKTHSINIFCSACDIDFSLKYSEPKEQPIRHCPFCGSPLDDNDIDSVEPTEDEEMEALDWPEDE